MKKRVAVIGAGISGLAFAKYVKVNSKNIEVKVFEKSDAIGGIAKVKDVEANIPYHMIGGHCFNSKFPHVMDFVFKHVLPESEWRKINRKASILFKGNSIGYPIEYSIKDIFKFDEKLALNIVKDFYSASKEPSTNLAEWFRNNFGTTLANEYFIPYNQKIWGTDPSNMTADWVTDKLPMPNDMEILKGLIDNGRDTMPHSSFYYPKAGTQNAFIKALATGLDIRINSNIAEIIENRDGTFEIGDETFDHIVYTGPLDEIANVFTVEEKVRKAARKLRYNKVTTMLWRSKPTEDTWTYIPGTESNFHRMIHIGNFTGSDPNYSITEAVGHISYDDMVNSAQNIELLLEPLDYNVSERAYVVFDQNVNEAKNTIFEGLSKKNVHLLGRFGEWEYFNMDICIKRAIEVFEEVVKG